MTKTLTEQWREGKLPENTYYVQFICGRYGIYEFEQFKGFGFDNDLAYIKEVLAPVPSYDEYEDILQQNVNQESAIETYIEEIQRLQDENKKLKEHIEEANEVIKNTKQITGNIDLSQFDYEHRRKIDGITMETDSYLEKWGVK